jgi:hypothetical protein
MWNIWWSELWFSCYIFHYRFWTRGCLEGKQRFIRLESWCWRCCARLRSFSLFFTPSIQPGRQAGSSRSKQAPCLWISPGLHPILSPLSEPPPVCPPRLPFISRILHRHKSAASLPWSCQTPVLFVLLLPLRSASSTLEQQTGRLLA